MRNVCKECGSTLIGDGYKVVVHCEEAQEELYNDSEPDANVEKNPELLLALDCWLKKIRGNNG